MKILLALHHWNPRIHPQHQPQRHAHAGAAHALLPLDVIHTPPVTRVDLRQQWRLFSHAAGLATADGAARVGVSQCCLFGALANFVLATYLFYLVCQPCYPSSLLKHNTWREIQGRERVECRRTCAATVARASLKLLYRRCTSWVSNTVVPPAVPLLPALLPAW